MNYFGQKSKLSHDIWKIEKASKGISHTSRLNTEMQTNKNVYQKFMVLGFESTCRVGGRTRYTICRVHERAPVKPETIPHYLIFSRQFFERPTRFPRPIGRPLLTFRIVIDSCPIVFGYRKSSPDLCRVTSRQWNIQHFTMGFSKCNPEYFYWIWRNVKLPCD